MAENISQILIEYELTVEKLINISHLMVEYELPVETEIRFTTMMIEVEVSPIPPTGRAFGPATSFST